LDRRWIDFEVKRETWYFYESLNRLTAG